MIYTENTMITTKKQRVTLGIRVQCRRKALKGAEGVMARDAPPS
jgi:hypothetical protein